MSKNLFDFGDEELKEEKFDFEQAKDAKITEETKQEAKNIYEKYKNYSQDELVDEFLSTSKSKIKNGSLSQENISNTVSKLEPYLNENQKEFLKSLMGKLNE